MDSRVAVNIFASQHHTLDSILQYLEIRSAFQTGVLHVFISRNGTDCFTATLKMSRGISMTNKSVFNAVTLYCSTVTNKQRRGNIKISHACSQQQASNATCKFACFLFTLSLFATLFFFFFLVCLCVSFLCSLLPNAPFAHSRQHPQRGLFFSVLLMLSLPVFLLELHHFSPFPLPFSVLSRLFSPLTTHF